MAQCPDPRRKKWDVPDSSRLLSARTLQCWLNGEASSKECLDKINGLAGDTWLNDVVYFLRKRAMGPQDTSPDAHQRRDAERILLFLRTGAEYTWPYVGVGKAEELSGTALGCAGILAMGLAVTVGLVGAIFLGLQWLLYACLLPFVGGAVLVGLGWLSMKYFYRRHERHREAIWTNLAAHSDKLRDINVYPFADHAQLRHAQIKCPHAYAPVPIPAGVERDADAARMADQASQAKLRAEQQQQARLVELTEALRANPGRCPNCGSKRFGRKPSDESEPSLVVAERRCKDCGCEWKPPWTRGDVITAIIAGAFLVLLLLCGCVLLAYSGFLGKADLSRARSWVALLVVFGSLVWLGGAGVRMIWLAIGRLRRERCLGHALKPGEPDGGE